MKEKIVQRIASIRGWMKDNGLAAFIVPSTDPHLSEYVAPHWESRAWISGFTGSAGTVVITMYEAGLWTDSRYFLQAANQLEGSGITLYKEMLPETPTVPQFLCDKLQRDESAGIDGKVFSTEEARNLYKQLSQKGIHLKDAGDPMAVLWADRPSMPDTEAFIHELKYSGQSCEEKIAQLRDEMSRQDADTLLISALDEIAWTLNLRGSDVHCNPVLISYLIINKKDAHLFINITRVQSKVRDYLEDAGIHIHPYEDITHYLEQLSNVNVWLTPAKTNYAVYNAISKHCRTIESTSPVAILKAIRNPYEMSGIRAAMHRDGIALVKFLKWLEKAVPTGMETELSVDKKLHSLRAEQALYMGESFDTIAGYKEHAAIVHYEASEESNAQLHPEGFLLLDSGAQYLDGTTDITRTIALGALSEEEKQDYTLILKGHIALAMAVFPEGTRGAQLDVLARMPIWKQHMNYLHGTGHGVGHFLNVHEGPQSIRMNENPIALQAGMLTSNEPGVYKAGSHGVRIENLILTVPAGEGMFGNYLKFETVTLCPICTKGIIKDLLDKEEINWLNQYHQKVYDALSPDLNADEQAWLKQACKPI